jgi:nucleoside-diphosphate-sugar epimerase
MILITAAGGKTGRHILTALRDRGQSVRILARSERIHELFLINHQNKLRVEDDVADSGHHGSDDRGFSQPRLRARDRSPDRKHASYRSSGLSPRRGSPEERSQSAPSA